MLVQYIKGYGYIDAAAARQASIAAFMEGDLELARMLVRHAQGLFERTLNNSVGQIKNLERATAENIEDSEGAELRFDCALLQILQEFGYIDYGKSIVAASEAHQRNDPAVALLFYRYARTFLESSLDESLSRLERLSVRIENSSTVPSST